ncbi:hypothetical protein RB595_004265 [Gaeumannomyces hyphopodioides]
MAASRPPIPVVGLYGISGSGKTTLAEALKSLQDSAEIDCTTTPQASPVPLGIDPFSFGGFSFKDGSELIGSAVPGGLAAFKRLGAVEKKKWRESVIRGVAKHAQESRDPVVVVGHYMLPAEAKDGDDAAQSPSPSKLLPVLQSVHTPADWESYTHIIYVTVPPETIAARRERDAARTRAPLGADALGEWQEAEKKELRRLCREHGVVFTVVDGQLADLAGRVRVLLEFIRRSERTLGVTRATGPTGRHPCIRYEEVIPGLYKSHVRVLAFDADRTLSAQDTGGMFWEMASAPVGMTCDEAGDGKQVPVLKQVFGGPLGYSRRAFVQAILLYEEAAETLGGGERFESLCAAVASQVEMRPEFISLLQRAVDDPLVVPVVVTCGLRRIWELVLTREGFRCGWEGFRPGETAVGDSEPTRVVRLVGAERVEALQPVVHPEHKAEVVRWLAGYWNAHLGEIVPSSGIGSNICAFGDSAVDIPMLKTAHRVFVVVDRDRQGGAMGKKMEEEIRMYSQDGALEQVSPGVYRNCLDEFSYLCRVELPPSKAYSPQATFPQEKQQQQQDQQLSLPVVSLTDPETIRLIFPPHTPETTALRPLVPVHDSTASAAAKLLSTPMRDASKSGRELQRAHRAAGRYLAVQVLPEVLGLERFATPHVCKDNGAGRGGARMTDGYRLLHEDRTLIVSLMRGGDPMAQGVFDVLPRATYLHAREPEDVRAKHLSGVVCVLLVDSVVNNGTSMLGFVHAIRSLHGTVRIVLVAGVVQAGAVEVREKIQTPSLVEAGGSGLFGVAEPGLEGPSMRNRFAEHGNVQIVTLRISTNKFKGVGGTDTGNRLFNTTHLDDC